MDEILGEFSIDCFGVVPFNVFEGRLICCRAKGRIPHKAKSVIVLCLPYLVDEFTGRNVSLYAVVKDYHIVFKDILQKVCDSLSTKYSEQFVGFTDNSPFPEVSAAVMAGLGIRGDNGLLITKKYGSFVFIGCIATTMELKSYSTPCNDRCLQCGLCIKHCPTTTLTAIGEVDYSGCLSHITQKKGELSDWEIKLIKQSGCAWGCDICQTVCPMNKGVAKTTVPEFISDTVSVVTSSNLDSLIKTRAFGYRGRAVIKRNIDILAD